MIHTFVGDFYRYLTSVHSSWICEISQANNNWKAAGYVQQETAVHRNMTVRL